MRVFRPLIVLGPRLSLGSLGLLAVILALTSHRALAQDLADVIEQAEKSVVRIEVKGTDGDGIGSGFVVDDRGTIVTNCHVLAGARTATAVFPDGTECAIQGTLMIDQERDIVVARISHIAAPPIAVRPALPRKGERVTALGSPHGLSFTATTGIISAIRSATEMAGDVSRKDIAGTWIQVDAALSPGNSGGPLINSAGEVVAMSTLASQGSAQNLNFGISGDDIAVAITAAANAALQSLPQGVGKIEMGDSRSGGATDAPAIPDAALDKYIAAGQADFKELTRGLRVEAIRMSADLKEMRRGQEGIPSNVRSEGAAVVRVTRPGMRNPMWFFASKEVKASVIERQQTRIRKLSELKSEIDDPQDRTAMFSLLWNHGPQLNTRQEGSVGFVSDLIALHAFNEHDVLVSYDDVPYLFWMNSTAGITAGELISGPVFVAGTATAELRNGSTSSVTVLAEVSETQLTDAIARNIRAAAPATAMRTWSDRTGRFRIEAVLLGADDKSVALKKSDGAIINVPRSALSEADQRFLEK
ncbi:MAG: trypsin-like peptidase domain-containing protein [Pirellulaceae bacterium]